jgi:hypothetical protein
MTARDRCNAADTEPGTRPFHGAAGRRVARVAGRTAGCACRRPAPGSRAAMKADKARSGSATARSLTLPAQRRMFRFEVDVAPPEAEDLALAEAEEQRLQLDQHPEKPGQRRDGRGDRYAGFRSLRSAAQPPSWARRRSGGTPPTRRCGRSSTLSATTTTAYGRRARRSATPRSRRPATVAGASVRRRRWPTRWATGSARNVQRGRLQCRHPRSAR